MQVLKAYIAEALKPIRQYINEEKNQSDETHKKSLEILSDAAYNLSGYRITELTAQKVALAEKLLKEIDEAVEEFGKNGFKNLADVSGQIQTLNHRVVEVVQATMKSESSLLNKYGEAPKRFDQHLKNLESSFRALHEYVLQLNDDSRLAVNQTAMSDSLAIGVYYNYSMVQQRKGELEYSAPCVESTSLFVNEVLSTMCDFVFDVIHSGGKFNQELSRQMILLIQQKVSYIDDISGDAAPDVMKNDNKRIDILDNAVSAFVQERTQIEKKVYGHESKDKKFTYTYLWSSLSPWSNASDPGYNQNLADMHGRLTDIARAIKTNVSSGGIARDGANDPDVPKTKKGKKKNKLGG